MAVEMSGGHGTPFYDPLYRPGTPTSQSEEFINRWYDDFSVFNHLHLPKSKALSFNASKQILQPVRQGGVVVKCEPQVAGLCEGKPKQATEEARSQGNQWFQSILVSKQQMRSPRLYYVEIWLSMLESWGLMKTINHSPS